MTEDNQPEGTPSKDWLDQMAADADRRAVMRDDDLYVVTVTYLGRQRDDGLIEVSEQ